MRTAQEIWIENMNVTSLEDDDIILAMIAYAREAIIEDRQNVAKRASLIGYYEEWKDDELVMDEDNYDCNYASPFVGNGRIIAVNENSIINAPMPDLK